MSGESQINFSVAEKYSYVYVDDKFSKLAVIAGGDAKLVDPLAWSYAETHSYVKVDPSSVGVAVPSSVTELYAKVIYVPSGTGGSSGGSSSDGISINDVKTYLNTNHYVTSSNVDSAISNISIPAKLSDLSNDVNFITSSYVDSAIAAISIPAKLSDLEDDSEFITSSYVDSAISNITIPTNISEFNNDAEYATSSYVDSAISNISIPTKVSELENDIEYATSSYVNSVVSNISILTKVSELENDEEYVKKSYVDALILDLSNAFNQKIAQIGSSNPDTVYEMGEHSNSINNLIINDRTDADTIPAGIIYGNRV